jgi:hypothetical protein
MSADGYSVMREDITAGDSAAAAADALLDRLMAIPSGARPVASFLSPSVTSGGWGMAAVLMPRAPSP